ncbi:MAG: tRNA dimethylallyltransferase, partial [Patescibacteria group bacterium]
SYFYIRTLLYGLSVPRTEPDWNLRVSLEEKSVSDLQDKLNKLQPHIVETMNNSDQNNKRRLIRRIEILSNQTKQELTTAKGIAQDYDVTLIGLRYNKKENLERAIRTRVEKRMEEGALSEIETLLRMGYSSTDPGLQTIGYAQLLHHIESDIDLYASIEIWVVKERQYAKRQMTFMTKNSSILWYNVDPTNK